MIRVIVRSQNRVGVVNAGGDVDTQYTTFDIEASELEEHLRFPDPSGYLTREVVGVELLDAAQKGE